MKFILPAAAMIIFFGLLNWNTEKVSTMYQTIGAFYATSVIIGVAFLMSYFGMYKLYKFGQWFDKVIKEGFDNVDEEIFY